MKWLLMLLIFGLQVLYADLTRLGDVVQDDLAGLEWQDSNISAEETQNWQEAISYCEALELDNKNDWRLPNKNELITIVDYGENTPAISPVFQHTMSNAYWSSTSLKGYYDYAWVIYFFNGYSYANFKVENEELYVRCVRDVKKY